MAHNSHILVVDPDRAVGGILKEWFQHLDYKFSFVESGDKAVDLIETIDFDVVLTENRIPAMSGIDLVKETARKRPGLPVVIIAGKYDSRTAIEVVKAGAFEFLPKPLEQGEALRAVEEAIQASRNAARPVRIGTGSPEEMSTRPVETLVGNSRTMLQVYKDLGRLSATPITVLIHGETGTGKELVARALYQHGHRSHRPFITVNCAAIPENLLESELFGHEKGAFTGAYTTRVGKFEQAHNATLFLDEIGDLDLSLQSKLLRVLQEKRFHRVGGADEILVDVRMIAATHRDLPTMIAEGTFREDLYYRLNVASIVLPPLREREGDIPLLARYFLKSFCRESGLPEAGMTLAAEERLKTGYWPGNVRQLQNVIRKAALNARGYSIDEGNVTALMKDQISLSAARTEILDEMREILSESEGDAHRAFLESFEARFLSEAMNSTGGNLSKAAQMLGISRYTLREKLKKYGSLTGPGGREC